MACQLKREHNAPVLWLPNGQVNLFHKQRAVKHKGMVFSLFTAHIDAFCRNLGGERRRQNLANMCLFMHGFPLSQRFQHNSRHIGLINLPQRGACEHLLRCANGYGLTVPHQHDAIRQAHGQIDIM